MSDHLSTNHDAAFGSLLAEYSAAVEAHRDAESEYSVANGVLTEARNRLNRAQRNITEYMEQLKKDAPRDSDWRRDKGMPA